MASIKIINIKNGLEIDKYKTKISYKDDLLH